MSRLTASLSGVAVLALAGAGLTILPAAAQAAAPPTCHGQRATLVGTPGKDHLVGTPGDDVIVALGGADVVKAGGGDDLVCGGDGADRIRGGAGADRLYGQRDGIGFDRGGTFRSPDVLVGGPGADLLDVGKDPRHVQQGGSHGVVTYRGAPRGVTVDLAAGTATGVGADRIVLVPQLEVVGSAYDDVLLGSPGPDDLVGLTGDDRLEGGDGNDALEPDEPHAAPDDDTVDGGAGADRIVAWRGRDVLHGDAGNDLVGSYSTRPSQAYGDAGTDDVFTSVTSAPGFVLDGGAGTDRGTLGRPGTTTRLHAPSGPTLVVRAGEGTVSRSGGQIGTVAGIETWMLGDDLRWDYYGTDGPDTVWGGYYWPFRAWTYGGDDDIEGSGKADHIDAGDGHDSVGGQEGHDTCLNAEIVDSCEVVSP